MITLVAHAVAPAGVQVALLWVAAAITAGGVLLVVLGPRGAIRGAAVVLAVTGAATMCTIYVLAPSAPANPGWTVSIVGVAADQHARSPMLLGVCATSGDGGTVASPFPAGDILSLSVDGRQVAETQTSTLAVQIPIGSHRFRAEIVTADHRAYAPPLAAELPMFVDGIGALPPAPSCSL